MRYMVIFMLKALHAGFLLCSGITAGQKLCNKLVMGFLQVVQTLVPRLFRGKSAYETTCMVCPFPGVGLDLRHLKSQKGQGLRQ